MIGVYLTLLLLNQSISQKKPTKSLWDIDDFDSSSPSDAQLLPAYIHPVTLTLVIVKMAFCEATLMMVTMTSWVT